MLEFNSPQRTMFQISDCVFFLAPWTFGIANRTRIDLTIDITVVDWESI